MPLTGFILIAGKMINPDHVSHVERNNGDTVVTLAKGNNVRALAGADADRVWSEFERARIQPATPSWSERARWSNDAFKIARDLYELARLMPDDVAKKLAGRVERLSTEIGQSAEAVEETAQLSAER